MLKSFYQEELIEAGCDEAGGVVMPDLFLRLRLSYRKILLILFLMIQKIYSGTTQRVKTDLLKKKLFLLLLLQWIMTKLTLSTF